MKKIKSSTIDGPLIFNTLNNLFHNPPACSRNFHTNIEFTGERSELHAGREKMSQGPTCR